MALRKKTVYQADIDDFYLFPWKRTSCLFAPAFNIPFGAYEDALRECSGRLRRPPQPGRKPAGTWLKIIAPRRSTPLTAARSTRGTVVEVCARSAAILVGPIPDWLTPTAPTPEPAPAEEEE